LIFFYDIEPIIEDRALGAIDDPLRCHDTISLENVALGIHIPYHPTTEQYRNTAYHDTSHHTAEPCKYRESHHQYHEEEQRVFWILSIGLEILRINTLTQENTVHMLLECKDCWHVRHLESIARKIPHKLYVVFLAFGGYDRSSRNNEHEFPRMSEGIFDGSHSLDVTIEGVFFFMENNTRHALRK